jgi:putative SOS response-associated peptidase YedK
MSALSFGHAGRASPRRRHRPLRSGRPSCYLDKMCGRASLIAPTEALEEFLGLDEPPPAAAPRYNIAPSQPLLIARSEAHGRVARMVTWGLLRDKKPIVNLRSEGVARGAMRRSLHEGRCVIPMTGFYEWRRSGKATQPYNVRRRDQGVFGVAGLWEAGALGERCVVLTKRASPVVEPIHDRMPLILDPASLGEWLDPTADADQLLAEVRPLADDDLEAYAVSALVNSPAVDDPGCLEPVRDASLW